MDVNKRIAYTQRILRGYALKKYREVLLKISQLAKELTVDEWNLGELAGIFAEDLWTWSNTYTTGCDGHPFLSRDKCVNFNS